MYHDEPAPGPHDELWDAIGDLNKRMRRRAVAELLERIDETNARVNDLTARVDDLETIRAALTEIIAACDEAFYTTGLNGDVLSAVEKYRPLVRA